MPSPAASSLKRVRLWTALFIFGLAASGLTAIPISSTFSFAAAHLGSDFRGGGAVPEFVAQWLVHVAQGIATVDRDAPYFYYGTDWLAFGHVAIAVAFIGAWRNPIRNRWIYEFGMIACAMVIPWALIFGSLRGLPPWWRAMDCSFGVFGFIPLWYCRKKVIELEKDQ